MQLIRQQAIAMLDDFAHRFVSRRRRLRRGLKAVREEYRKKVADARTSRNAALAEQLLYDGQLAARDYEDSLEAIDTQDLLNRARRANVQIPVRPSISSYLDNNQSDPTWYLSQMTGEWYLTYDGFWKLHKEVRAEERERIQTWTGVIGMLTGLVGAAAALVAILNE